MLIRPISILVATASLALAGHALAQSDYGPGPGPDELTVQGIARSPDVEVKSQLISYADLDLSGPAGAHTLLMRIRGAAEQVCSPEAFIRDFRDSEDYRDCKDEAMSRAVDQVDSPLVAGWYRERY